MSRVSRRPAPDTRIIGSPNSLTAAAQRIPTTTQTPTTLTTGGWKNTAWQRFDQVGELRAVTQWISNTLSRVRLIASDIDPTTNRPTGATEDTTATELVGDIAGGPAGQAAMLGRLGTFLTVPGEGWIAVITRTPNPGHTVEEWHVLSDTEVDRGPSGTTIRLQDGTDHTLDDQADSLFRVHRPHPRNARESDSPVRAALPILGEIVRATQLLDGASKSRLSGNGILAIPTEVSMPTGAAPAPAPDPDAPGLPAPAPVGDTTVTAESFMEVLGQVMSTAIADQSSAAATVPIVIKAPGDYLDKITHLRLDSELPELALKTREAAIRRLALSLDIPPEVLTGTADSNHWSAWAQQEQALSHHIAPMMTVICDALTEAVLRPLLAYQGHPDPDRVVVWFDMSEVAARPDRAEDATAAYDRGVISADVYRRALGWGDTDAPHADDEVERRNLAYRMVTQAPSLYPYLAEYLGMPAPADATGLTPTTGAPAPGPAEPSTPPTPDTRGQARG